MGERCRQLGIKVLRMSWRMAYALAIQGYGPKPLLDLLERGIEEFLAISY